MRPLLLSLTCACALVGPPGAPAAEQIVPVDLASYHVPSFSNADVRVLRVNIPGKRSSGYHTHTHDTVCVVVEDYPPEGYSQPLGGPPGPPRGAARGELSFIDYSGKPLTHTAINPGALPRHSICTELLAAQPRGASPAARAVPGYRQELDNARVRAWRLVLAPGERASAITQNAPGMRVVVQGGEIAESVPGRSERGIMLRPGEFYWQEAGTTRAVRNIGTTPVELIEFELK
jgi:mannose-6-phosphate isomerase-like protein (cupin superfamily)